MKNLSRRAVSRRSIHPSLWTVADYPLATGLSIWGLVISVLVLVGEAPSRTINALPVWQASAWAGFTLLSAGTVLWGLFETLSAATVSRGLFGLSIMITIFWVSIVRVAGWGQGGAVGSFLMVIALVAAREAVALRHRANMGGRR